MSNPFGSVAQDVTVAAGALIGAASDVETIVLNGSSGDDTFNVDSYKDGTTLFINAGAGNDTANFGKGNLGANITSIAGFEFDGQSGNDTFNLLSSGDLSGIYTRSNFSSSVGMTSYINQFQTYNISLLDAATELTQIYPASAGPSGSM